MIFGPLPVAECEGAVLAHSQVVDGTRLAKGRVLSAEDIKLAAEAGLAHLTVAKLEPGDVPEDEAAAQIGRALAGSGVAAAAAVHGRVNLTATVDGIAMIDTDAVHSLNEIDEAITLGVVPPFARVAAGDVVATVKIIPFAVDERAVAGALRRANQLMVAPFRQQCFALVQTRLPGQADKLFAKTVEVTRARVEALGGALVGHEICPHETLALSGALKAAGADIVLIAGASATADRRDVVPAAIEAAGGRIERLGMPVDPGNLLCLGSLGGRPVLGLPGCARSPKRNGVDLVLERLAAGLPVDSATIALMGIGGVLPDLERPEPRSKTSPRSGPIGAVLLAAGRSTRMGSNKLLADLGGRPVAARTFDGIEKAGLPALVVLGNMADEVRAAIGHRAHFVHASDYAEGLSRSLRAGILAVPAAWRAAVVCLGDMPEVPPGVLTALAQAFHEPHDIVVPTWRGKRGNPVLWGRAHFARLASLSGDVGGKALMAEYAEHVIEVEVDTEAVLADIDTPVALEAARGRQPS